MRKTFRKVLSLLLTAVLLFGLLAVSAAAASVKSYENPLKVTDPEGYDKLKYDYYVSLGDSISAGCGLESFFVGGLDGKDYRDDGNATNLWNHDYDQGRFLEGNYNTIVRDRLAKEGSQLGRAGWRTNEMLLALGYEGIEQDDFDLEFFPGYVGGMQTYADIIADEADYIAEIRKADLITICFGGNDLAGNALFAATKVLEEKAERDGTESDVRKIIDEALSMKNENESLAELLEFADTVDVYGETIAAVMKSLADSVEVFRNNWDAIISQVRQLNKDAKIVALNVYNPGSTLADGLDLAAAIELFISSVNLHIALNCPYRSEYCVADVTQVSFEGSIDGSHPAKIGNAYMADQVFAALQGQGECKHDMTIRLFQTDATLFADGYTGDVVCVECGTLVEPGHSVNILGFVTESNTVGFSLILSLLKIISDFFAKIMEIL